MRFVDQATITIRSGKGGHGCVSFRREKYIPKGGPDGGDGGRGGDIIFKASNRLLTLYDFRIKRIYQAENGRPGQGRQKYGRAGRDMVVEVPVGTLVYQLPLPVDEAAQGDKDHVPGKFDESVPLDGAVEDDAETVSSEPEQDLNTDGEERLIADLDEDGKTVCLAKGGIGGKGNTHFKSSTNRAPRYAQPGMPGEEKKIRLELKILADAGLVGLPNAGKSTFISHVSAARPKIAPYPFTTLTPNLGVVEDDYGKRLVIADIPGLIEGAHIGLGLGLRFLRHVERTRVLVHLLSIEDIPADALEGGQAPWAGFDLINSELAEFDPRLREKPQLEVVNKIDLWPEENVARLRALAEQSGRKIFFISALQGTGVDELMRELWDRVLSV